MTEQVADTKPFKPNRRKPAAPKRKPRKPSPEEILYEVRDIIDEKFVKGKLLYRVDWADDPTTGEPFDPTWEPAENVTEAAVADWEAEKRRRQGLETQSSGPSAESDNQPVLHPNWRSKRRRSLSVAEDDDSRTAKRLRRSVDSGYTSTDGDLGSSPVYAEPEPNRNSTIVLEIERRPDFDPSEYKVVTSSQHAPSSQATESATFQGDSQKPASGPTSQRTIADSQDYLSSLRTQSTIQSALPAEDRAGPASHSDPGIPCRQPEALGLESWPSVGLLETQQPVRDTSQSSRDSQHQLGDQGFLDYISSSGGFLTQPHLHHSIGSQHKAESAFDHESYPAGELSLSGAPQTGTDPQAAQEVSPLYGHSGFLTQVLESVGQSSEDVVPDTVQKVHHQHSSNMDGSEEIPRRSAVEMMRQLQAEVFGAPPAATPADNNQSPALVSPSAVLPPMGASLAEHLEVSAAPANQPAELSSHVGDVRPGDPAAGPLAMEYERPTTVDPADLTASVEPVPSAHDQVPEAGQAVPVSIEPAQSPLDDGAEDRRFTVTLPMAANTRATYLETISENRATMIEFGEVFATSRSSVPEPSLVAKIDGIFERLLNLCDLPAYDEDLPDLNKDEMMKHATNSNSKFSFVFELLNMLWGVNVRVLILSQPGRVFDYLEAVVSTTRCPYTIFAPETPLGQPAEGFSVVLAAAGQDISGIQGVDVVIAFDRIARSVELPATLGFGPVAPVVLSLVATYSLDHIDQQLAEREQDLDDLEKRNALNVATATAIEYLRNPDRRQYIEPHEVAKMFAVLLSNPGGELDWEPHPLPADILEVWLSSQERPQVSQVPDQPSQADNQADLESRKRPSDSIDEGTPKRPRILESQQPSRNSTPARMSDLLKRTLANHAVDVRTAATQLVEVPVEQLEQLSDKIAELEARLATNNVIEAKTREHCLSLESQLRSHERTIQTLQPKYMDALRDRGTFEKQCQKAVELLEAQTAEVEPLRQRVKDLEAKLADANNMLANSANPDVAKLASMDKLEKKAECLQNELNYSRRAYQDASNAHTELHKENQDLKKKIADLERRASENLLKIHQIHAHTESAEANRRIDELQAVLENRERELERAKEELKILKSGRRETRQGSVPRSPRTTAMMSPRPGRGASGTGSRGTSPAPFMSSDGPSGVGAGGSGGGVPALPGMTFFPPAAGNGGRWGHLRD